MEKKSGTLDLKGRRASTAPVLSENLAILVCDLFITALFFPSIPFCFTMSSYARISQLSLVFLDLGRYFIHLTSMEYR
jgi:hypothetical protein